MNCTPLRRRRVIARAATMLTIRSAETTRTKKHTSESART